MFVAKSTRSNLEKTIKTYRDTPKWTKILQKHARGKYLGLSIDIQMRGIDYKFFRKYGII